MANRPGGPLEIREMAPGVYVQADRYTIHHSAYRTKTFLFDDAVYGPDRMRLVKFAAQRNGLPVIDNR